MGRLNGRMAVWNKQGETTMKQDLKTTAGVYLMLLATFFLWGSVYVAGKYLAGSIPSPFISAARACIGCLPLWLMARPYRAVKIEKADRKYFLLVGIMGYYLTFVINQLGVARAGASLSALINTVNPVTIALLAALILKEPIRRVQIVCLVLAIAGAWVVLAGAETGGQLLGLVLVLLSVLTWGIASVYIRRLTAKYPAILVTFYGMLISTVFHIPTAAFSAARAGGLPLSAHSVLLLLYLGICTSGLAQFLWSRSLSLLPATTCSLFYPLQPVFSALLGVWFLGESFGPNFWWGLLLIGGDIVLNCLDGIHQQKAAK